MSLTSRLKSLVVGGSPRPAAPPASGPRVAASATHRRFLSDASERREALLAAAQQYVAAMTPFEVEWLRRKPFDPRAGHDQFFLQLSSLLNLLKAMDLPPGGRVLEVGSGPGWISEILMLLGQRVDGIEPSSAMVAIAEERIAAARGHYRVASPPTVTFHTATIEDVALPEGEFDAVLFHDALHHVIDERRALTNCFRALKRGGVLGVCEDAWKPGDRQQEATLEAEMRRFGTLENPFTQVYLDELLTEIGFAEIERYHAVNGFFPAELGGRTLEQVAQSRAAGTNNLTARKPAWTGVTTGDPSAVTRARIEVGAATCDARDRRLTVSVRLTNTGETAWRHRPGCAGWVSVALRALPPGDPRMREAVPRHRLPRTVLPGEVESLVLEFFLPEGYEREAWQLDLVNEGLFWFSQRDTTAANVGLAGPSAR